MIILFFFFRCILRKHFGVGSFVVEQEFEDFGLDVLHHTGNGVLLVRHLLFDGGETIESKSHIDSDGLQPLEVVVFLVVGIALFDQLAEEEVEEG